MCATNVATLASREYSDGMQSFSSFAGVVAVQTKNGGCSNASFLVCEKLLSTRAA